MSRVAHTYGPTCHLGPSVAFSGCSKEDDDIPQLKVHYFYSSPQPIDDPLSVVPIPSGADSKSANHPPRPFSAYDNKALEEAWASIRPGKKKGHIFEKKSRSPSRKVAAAEHSAAVAAESAIHSEEHMKRNSHHGHSKSTRSHTKKPEGSSAPIEAAPHDSVDKFESSSSNEAYCPELSEGQETGKQEAVGDENQPGSSKKGHRKEKHGSTLR